MKIVEPSFEIQDDLDRSSLAVRLEACGRVCYKSEDKITEDSAIPFVTKVSAHGHNSVLEMAVATFDVTCRPALLAQLFACQPRFLIIDPTPAGCIVTGSIRAYREISLQHCDNPIVNGILAVLHGKTSYLFEGVFSADKVLPREPGLDIRKMSLSEVENMPMPLLRRHRHVGVRFIVNRAVTHELVRHRPCSFLQESQRYCRYSQDKFGNQVTFIKPVFFEKGTAEYSLWQQAMEETERLYLQLLETSTPQAARTVLPNSCKTEIIMYCNISEWKHIFSLRTTQAAEPSMREIMIPLAAEFRKRYPLL
ncbi:FAD-dependent thymidylate synthase [Desulfoprunum benzoelyticum]|uniref:Thymidylate synthase (FAD) n=1 Tax=Desulfoprunum benzoelyticum TaxID=1506996 RepID=A0A840UZF9_9BACT|nr:FAD-dependent thymidylate synthase [Desulfoprunum benzoelyticum]MBB5346371.1 thymidylate synthase (FAD) [Desulfoprunum benzoelyticum]MBM9528630.1 FAD-dependent thymidylate synthase [Desulfoprunum benzoelyticum]